MEDHKNFKFLNTAIKELLNEESLKMKNVDKTSRMIYWDEKNLTDGFCELCYHPVFRHYETCQYCGAKLIK